MILSGPSGVGKDSLLDAWIAVDPRVRRVVTYTTRPPRSGEQDGVDYHFVSPSRFEDLVKRGAFLEYKQVHGYSYASPLHDTEAMLAKGEVAVLKIDVQGAMEAVRKRPDAITVFILPPSVEALKSRMRGRGKDDEATIARRLKNAVGEIEQSSWYAYRIVNDDLDEALRQVRSAIGRAP